MVSDCQYQEPVEKPPDRRKATRQTKSHQTVSCLLCRIQVFATILTEDRCWTWHHCLLWLNWTDAQRNWCQEWHLVCILLSDECWFCSVSAHNRVWVRRLATQLLGWPIRDELGWLVWQLVVGTSVHRPDMTFAVDWALSNNYLSIYQCSSIFSQMEVEVESSPLCVTSRCYSCLNHLSWPADVIFVSMVMVYSCCLGLPPMQQHQDNQNCPDIASVVDWMLK